MVDIRDVTDSFAVAPQLFPDEAPAVASRFTLLVNNRPDGEEPDQPGGAEIEAAARAAGIEYRHIPVSGGFNMDDVLAMAEALDGAQGQALLFCRSGTRSTFLWALARSERGTPADELTLKAAAAGYDLKPILAYLGR